MRRITSLLLVVAVLFLPSPERAEARGVIEGNRGWDCRTMGNRACGPSAKVAELARIIEGQPGWDCTTMGNGSCGPGTTSEDLVSLMVWPAVSGTTERVSVSSAEEEANGPSDSGVDTSRNGRFVVFNSSATNLVPDGDTNGVDDVFVRDRLRGTTERVNVSSSGEQAHYNVPVLLTTPSISADGRFVAFASQATNLVEDDTNGRMDVFVHDRRLGTTERASVATLGAQADGASASPDISADGRFVAFDSVARNLTPEQALDPEPEIAEQGHVFVRDRLLGVTERASVNDVGLAAAGSDGSNGSDQPSISGDGRFVAFDSDATNLVPDDTNGRNDVFVRDRLLRTTRRVSVTSDGEERFERRTGGADISADGRSVAFESEADFTAEACPRLCVYVRDLDTGTMDHLDVSLSGGPSCCASASLRDDGRAAAVASSVALVPEDTNGLRDIYLWHRGTDALTIVSLSSAGDQGDGPAFSSQIFGNGRGVAFSSRATDLVENDTNGVGDVFVRSG